jgi:hypothetical protein
MYGATQVIKSLRRRLATNAPTPYVLVGRTLEVQAQLPPNLPDANGAPVVLPARGGGDVVSGSGAMIATVCRLILAKLRATLP